MISKIKNIDKKILMYIAKLQKPFLNKIMIFFTVMGNNGVIWLLISVPMLLNYSSRTKGIKLIVSLTLVGFMGEIIIKRLVGRERPFDEPDFDDVLNSEKINFKTLSTRVYISFRF